MATVDIPIEPKAEHLLKGLCEYCRTPDNISTPSFHCEHIVPQAIEYEQSTAEKFT